MTKALLGNSYVAFLDVLGFSEMVESDCEVGPMSSSPNLDILHDVHNETIGQISGKNEIKLTQFSDSVVFSRKFDASVSVFKEFIDVVLNFQYRLFSKGLLCRGGVSYGKHFEDGSFLFSKGLINAYRIESSMAKFPRVVLDDNLLQLVCPSHKELLQLPLLKADDETFFVDYLREVPYDVGYPVVLSKWQSAKNRESAIRDKILWLVRYFDFSFRESNVEPMSPSFFHQSSR